MLERQAVEERFASDILLGDLSFETSYGLPGEATPARVRADILLGWPTWSQTAYRDWYIGDGFSDSPRIDIGVTFRVQELAEPPDLATVLAIFPTEGAALGGTRLYRSGPTVEQQYGHDLSDLTIALEVSYAGSYELGEGVLEDGSRLDADVSGLGGWVTSTLVKMGDLKLIYLPTIL